MMTIERGGVGFFNWTTTFFHLLPFKREQKDYYFCLKSRDILRLEEEKTTSCRIVRWCYVSTKKDRDSITQLTLSTRTSNAIGY